MSEKGYVSETCHIIIDSPLSARDLITWMMDHAKNSLSDVTNPHIKGSVNTAIEYLENALVALEGGDADELTESCLFAGMLLSELPGWTLAGNRIRRTKTQVVDRIRELRSEGKETWEIAEILESEGYRKQQRSGKQKPWNENDIKSYMKRHAIS